MYVQFGSATTEHSPLGVFNLMILDVKFSAIDTFKLFRNLKFLKLCNNHLNFFFFYSGIST